MPPSASAMFPDNPGRFQSSHPCNLQRATHTPPRKNKQKQINNIHFQFHGILTVLVRRPCAPSKHRLDKGGKPKVDVSQMLPRCIPDACQMLPRCFPDAQRCLPDASQMLPRSQMPRCHPDASQMPPRCFPVPPLPLMCRRWTRRDSGSNPIFLFFACLKMMVEIIAKCCKK